VNLKEKCEACQPAVVDGERVPLRYTSVERDQLN